MAARADRRDRTLQFLHLVLPRIEAAEIVVIGDGGDPIITAHRAGRLPAGKITDLCGAGVDEVIDAVAACARTRPGSTLGLLVLSPHGGGIEPGSSELADAIAGYDHGRYDFSGVRSVGNRDLHLSVLNFDEPEAMRLQATATRSVALHGAAGSTPRVLVDGLDAGTVAAVRRSWTAAGFTVASDPSYGGNLEGNIVNRNASGAGVHIEVTSGLRQEMFDGGLDRAARQHPTPVFDLFVAAVRDAL
jgi:phage replication-related protein YjqB (UPF0714/DUF867 family)